MDDREWHATVGADRARQAALRIAEREIRAELNADQLTVDEFDRLVAERADATWRAIVNAMPANPLEPSLVSWPDFWAADHEDEQWLIHPLVAATRSHAVFAGAKTGKSFLMLAACAALATGRPFLGTVNEPTDVLYLDYEMSPADLRSRLEEFGYGPDDDLSRLHYALLPSLPPLDTEDGGLTLLEAVHAVHAKFVVIDTTSRAVSGDENDADTIRAFYRHSGLLLKQQQVAWSRLDHAGKDVTRGQRGSSAKNDDVDIVLRLERTDSGIKVVATHRRMSWFPEVTAIDVRDDGGVTVFELADGPGWPAGTKETAEVLDRLGLPVDVPRRVAREALQEAGVKTRNAVLGAALRWRKAEQRRRLEEQVAEFEQRHGGHAEW